MRSRVEAVLLSLALLACAPPAEETPSSGECARCHASDFERARHPPHVGVRPTTCGVCHTQLAWSPDVLDHEWELTGAHADATCFDCHVGSPRVFEGTPTECVGCHRDDESHTFAAHHTFGTDCASCHTTTAWRPAAHPPEPEPEPAPMLDAGPPDAGPPARVTRPRTTRPTTTRTPTTRPTPPPTPPPDTTTQASQRR